MVCFLLFLMRDRHIQKKSNRNNRGYMRYIIILVLFFTVSDLTAGIRRLEPGKYALSEIINTIDPKTKKPQKLTIIETLEVVIDLNGDLEIIPLDSKTDYFGRAVGYIDSGGGIVFGFTLLKNKKLFSVNYSGKLTDDGYIKGKLIGIYPKAENAVKGDWAMKMITDSDAELQQFLRERKKTY